MNLALQKICVEFLATGDLCQKWVDENIEFSKTFNGENLMCKAKHQTHNVSLFLTLSLKIRKRKLASDRLL